MIQHVLPSTGGGYPVIAAAARAVNLKNQVERVTLLLRLTADADAAATGREVVECIRRACIQRDLEDVSTLHALFPNVVSRVPEFHVVLAELFESDPKSVARLLRLPTKGPGRPREDEFYFVALVEYVMRAEGFDHATDAIDWLHANRTQLVLPDDYLPVAKTLRNKHSELATYFRLWSRSMYVGPELLTLLPPALPGIKYDDRTVERCRYPPTDGSAWPYGLVIEIRHPPKK